MVAGLQPVVQAGCRQFAFALYGVPAVRGALYPLHVLPTVRQGHTQVFGVDAGMVAVLAAPHSALLYAQVAA